MPEEAEVTQQGGVGFGGGFDAGNGFLARAEPGHVAGSPFSQVAYPTSALFELFGLPAPEKLAGANPDALMALQTDLSVGQAEAQMKLAVIRAYSQRVKLQLIVTKMRVGAMTL